MAGEPRTYEGRKRKNINQIDAMLLVRAADRGRKMPARALYRAVTILFMSRHGCTREVASDIAAARIMDRRKIIVVNPWRWWEPMQLNRSRFPRDARRTGLRIERSNAHLCRGRLP